MTNQNILPTGQNIAPEIIEFLDPTVESLFFEESVAKNLIHLKFRGKDELILNSGRELENYLSSGTIKGITTFSIAIKVIKTGGYLVIDEIENHFNREIVATLLRFFMDSNLNKKGGSLIFTTHYPELLDEFDRNDAIHILRNRDGITVENLNSLLKRNDMWYLHIHLVCAKLFVWFAIYFSFLYNRPEHSYCISWEKFFIV